MYIKTPLLEIESTSIALHIAGVSTITFFEGDIKSVEEEIRERFKNIALVNPWLCSKLVKNKEIKRLQMLYPSTIEEKDIDNILQKNPQNLTINSKMTYDELCKEIRPYLVKSPSGMINKDKYVTSLILVQDSQESSKFALVFSMSHSVADGHTYYSIFNMLSNKSDITTLHVDRKEFLMNDIVDAFGTKQYNYLKSIPHVVNVFKGMFFGKRSKAHAYFIDEKKVDTIKQNVKSENGFISTNDILTSTFSNFIDSRLTLMAINFRDKLDGLGQKDAGNYEGAVLYDKEVYKDALGIRKSLNSKPYLGLSKALPSFFEGMFCKMGLITNWSSFCKELYFENAKQTLHMPITNSAGNAPYEMAVVFKPMSGKLGIIYFTHKFSVDDYKNSQLPLGELIKN